MFKAKALEIFREIEASGEPVIVTDHGRPVLQMRRFQSVECQPLEVLRGSVLCYVGPSEPVAADDWDAAR